MAQTFGAGGNALVDVRPTLGLSATFFGVITVNSTGSEVVATNAHRKLGVWIQNSSSAISLLVGDNINSAVVIATNPGASNSPQPLFIPGTGPVYAKALTNPVSVTGFYI